MASNLFSVVQQIILSAAAPDAAGGGAPASTDVSNPLMQMLFPLLLCFFIFYFLLIRPQQKQRQRHEEQVNQLKKGDKIVTSGGIFGSIVGMKDNIAVIKIAENVKIEILKSSISQIIGHEDSK
ncbi:MAG: preprotein translocase subunit YajC [Candidatus Omnitrophota bacterium]